MLFQIKEISCHSSINNGLSPCCKKKAGDALASLIYCSCVSSSVKSITVLACLPDVVDYPHYLGPTTKTAPFDLRANFKVSSNSLGI